MIGDAYPDVECPYCGSRQHTEVKEFPYPYKRLVPTYPAPKFTGVDFLQFIRKLMCRCGNHFYYSMRQGWDMGLGNNNVYCQTYRQGHYRFREGDTILKGDSK